MLSYLGLRSMLLQMSQYCVISRIVVGYIVHKMGTCIYLAMIIEIDTKYNIIYVID